MATLSFQEYVMTWWKQRQYDVSIERKIKIMNWHELKECIRRKFGLPSYEKNKKIREEMNELVKIGRKIIDGEKEYIRREKEYREKLQANTKTKEKRDKEKKEKRDNEKKEEEETRKE